MLIMAMVTVPKEKADFLSKLLLQERVCACVNIVDNVRSFFWWQNKIDSGEESLLIIKTKNLLFPKLQSLIKSNHPYQTPEIIAFDINHVNSEYLNWVNHEANAQPY